MNKWKTTAAACMIAVAVTLAGCGSLPTMMESYSFGTVQLKAGNSEVYMDSPFDLAHVQRPNGSGMMYVNNDEHVNVIVVSQPVANGSAQAMAEHDVAMLKQTPDISDLQTKLTTTTIDGKAAVEGYYTYTEPLKGVPADLIVRSLFFEDSDQVWHIMFMYRQGDAMAQDVTDHVFGHIHY